MVNRLLSVAIFGLVAYALLAAGAWVWVSYVSSPHIADSVRDVTPVQAGLVLGASPRNRNGDAPNAYFAYRIDAAAALYKAGKIQYLIVSGDRRDDGYDEPTAMRDALVAEGVPPNRIYRDAAGFHTRDSVARAHLLFGLSDALVISQRFHAERAIFMARAHGLRFSGYAAQDVDAYFGVLTMARETFSRIVALVDAYTSEKAAKSKAITLGSDTPS